MHRTKKSGFLSLTGSCLLLASMLATSGCAINILSDSTPVADIETVDSEIRAEFNAAMKVLNAGNYTKGIELLTQLTQHTKTNTAPYINLAIAYQKIGSLTAAEDNLKKALALSPDHPIANNEYGLLYRQTGRFSEAKKTYEKVLDKYPSFLPARKNLGILCDVYLKDLDCALKHYQLYSRAAPEDKAVEIWIADLQTRLKD